MAHHNVTLYTVHCTLYIVQCTAAVAVITVGNSHHESESESKRGATNGANEDLMCGQNNKRSGRPSLQFLCDHSVYLYF